MWYSARLIVQCIVGSNLQEDDFLFDEQIRLIKASNPEEAYQKSICLSQAEELEYKNANGELVKWVFKGLFDLDVVSRLKDGAEISSRRFRADSDQNWVFSKEKLSVFYQETMKGKTVQQLLNESEKSDE